MAIIAFWSNEKKETGQSLSVVALSTYMAIEHNYKILNISTDFIDKTIENSYWNMEKRENLVKNITSDNAELGLEAGLEGLVKIVNSNKTSTSIVSNYSKIVFKDRLDVLCAPKTEDISEYNEICRIYPDIAKLADRYYDFIFIDISKNMPEEQIRNILELSDVIVINMTQRLKTINNIIKLKEENDFFKKNNIMINIGRYDGFSKYNIKNVSRYMKEKKDVHVVPYNTLFFESSSDGKVAEFFLRLRRIDGEDRNANFIEEIQRTSKDLIYKLQELQIKL